MTLVACLIPAVLLVGGAGQTEVKVPHSDTLQASSPSVWYSIDGYEACTTDCYGDSDIHRTPGLQCDKLFWLGINDPRSTKEGYETIECDTFTVQPDGSRCYCRYPSNPADVQSKSGYKTYRTKRGLNAGMGECKPGYFGFRAGSTPYPCLHFKMDSWCAKLDQNTQTAEEKAAMKELGFEFPCVPGAQYIGMGWDITTDSADPTMLPSVGKPQIWQLLFEPGSSDSTILGNRMSHPSAVSVQPLNTLNNANSASSFSSAEEYSRNLATKIGLKGTLKGVKLGGMVSGSQSLERAFSNNKNAATMSVDHALYVISIGSKSTMLSWLTNYAGYNRDVRPSLDEADKKLDLNSAMHKFVQEYGTHVITHVTMGARIEFEVETSACTTSEETSRAIKTSVNATLPEVPLGGDIEGSVSTDQSSSTEGSDSVCRQKVSGGTTSHCQSGSCSKDTCDYAKWSESVGLEDSALLVPIDFKVESIYDLLNKHLTVEHLEPLDTHLKRKLEAASPKTAKVDKSSCGNAQMVSGARIINANAALVLSFALMYRQ